MSGIVGIVHGDGKPIDPSLLQRMTDLMKTRGPDRQATWSDGSVGLGHALLCTTWESEGEQGPNSLDGRLWMTGDVRLDRRDELMARLGADLRDATDTDLVLHAYQMWGDACLDHFTGDFAFAIWDRTRPRLFCARDQFGVVPFYYAEIGDGLIFSNTLNCLRLHPRISDDLNPQAIGDHLLFHMNLDVSTTTFSSIRKLPPGHTLIWSGNGTQVRRYWQLPRDVGYVRFRDGREYVERFRELFERAVADRLRTQAAGTHLSGGLDSTSIAATAYRCIKTTSSPVDFRAYTIVARDLVPDDEGDFAGQVAQAAGFPLDSLVVDDFMQRPPSQQPLHITPEPLAIPDQMAHWEITRRVASFSSVLLAGFGGDPALSPSPSYWPNLLKSGRVHHLLRDAVRCLLSVGRLPRLGLRAPLRRLLGRAPGRAGLPDWLDPDFAQRTHLQERLQKRLSAPPLKDRYGMESAPLWSNIFGWSDPGFTDFPVKLRFPFFDVRLVRYLLSVPPSPWFEEKYLLREAMRGTLPETVRRRPKTLVAGSPSHNLLRRQGVQPWMRDLASTPALKAYVRSERLLRTLQDTKGLTPVRSKATGAPLRLAHWLRHQRRPG